MLEALRGLAIQILKNDAPDTPKEKSLEDAIAACILVVQDAIRVFQSLDLSLTALHALFVAHARISDASRKKLLPLLRLGVEEALLSLDLLEIGSNLFGGRRQVIRRRRQSRRLRADAHLRFALVVHELSS